jgi:hypothetical protein
VLEPLTRLDGVAGYWVEVAIGGDLVLLFVSVRLLEEIVDKGEVGMG